MKRPLTRTLSLLLSLVLILGTVTLCWLSLPDTVDFPTSFGSANAAYFESGDGSASDPYVISQPVHLYNLAWLQYLGYFNLNSSLNNGRAQSYFKLKNNIVMTGVAIPPIGTEEYPFIGKFDGNHCTVSSLTVSNSLADLTRHPTAAVFDTTGNLQTAGSDKNKMTEVAIIGLFGVTGDYGSAIESGDNDAYKGKNIQQYVDPDAEVKELVSPPDLKKITKDDLYYASMFVGNFYTDILHVRSASTKTLIGLVAGYVKGTLEKVGVYRADLTLVSGAKAIDDTDATPNVVVSKYAIVGDYDETAVGWAENPATGGLAPGWGNSIDFKSFSKRLTYMITRTYEDTDASGNNKKKPTTSAYFDSNTTFHFNFRVYFPSSAPKGSQYDYSGLADGITYGVCELKDGTYLPLGVNEDTMFKDAVDGVENKETSGNVTGWKINTWYQKTSTAELPFENTGYIVGGDGGSSSGHVKIRIQPLVSNIGTIYNSLLGSTNKSDASYVEEVGEDEKNVGNLLLYTKKDDNSGFYGIKDSYNQNNSLLPTACIDATSLLNYTASRGKFKDFLGGNGYLYGMRFDVPQNYIALADTGKKYLSIDGKEYVKRAINFTVKEEGVITAVVGAYVDDKSNQSMFALYKITRKPSDQNSIQSVDQVSRVYKYNGTDAQKEKYPTVYVGEEENDSYKSDDEYTKTYDRTWFTVLTPGTAYYVEIPVDAGEYAITKDFGTTNSPAYIMYLDIGANGGTTTTDTSKSMPYLMQSVDFINDSSVDDNGKAIVPTVKKGSIEEHFYPAYADVSLKLSGVTGDVTVALKRATGTDTRVNKNNETEYTAVLNYSTTYNGSLVSCIQVDKLPDGTTLVAEDTTLRKEEDESG